MKNRKFVVAAFLLAAAMLLGVGYAALTDTLDITGSADINVTDMEKAYEDDIYFVTAVALDPDDDDQTVNPNTASVNSQNNDKASFSAKSLSKKGDKAKFTFTIANTSVHTVTVEPKLNASAGNTNPTWFKITSDWNGAAQTIAASDGTTAKTITYTVTIELLQDPTEAVSGSFLIELVATAGTTNSGSN